jgi:hypothetical protein
VSVQFQSTEGNATLTDPGEDLLSGPNSLTFSPASPVTITLTTSDSSDEVALGYYGPHPIRTINGTAVYTLQFTTPRSSGVAHATVSVLSNQALLGQDHYDSDVWVIPYVVTQFAGVARP